VEQREYNWIIIELLLLYHRLNLMVLSNHRLIHSYPKREDSPTCQTQLRTIPNRAYLEYFKDKKNMSRKEISIWKSQFNLMIFKTIIFYSILSPMRFLSISQNGTWNTLYIADNDANGSSMASTELKEREEEIVEIEETCRLFLHSGRSIHSIREIARANGSPLCARSSNELEMHMRNECSEERGKIFSWRVSQLVERRVATVSCRNREAAGDTMKQQGVCKPYDFIMHNTFYRTTKFHHKLYSLCIARYTYNHNIIYITYWSMQTNVSQFRFICRRDDCLMNIFFYLFSLSFICFFSYLIYFIYFNISKRDDKNKISSKIFLH